MMINKTIKIYASGNMVIFTDPDYGLMQAVPKGAIRIYPFQSPNVGFQFVDIRTMNVIAQIRDWGEVQNSAGSAWGSDYQDTLEKLCLFFDVTGGDIIAETVSYNNSESLLTSTNVQDAINEVVNDTNNSVLSSSTQWQRTLASPVAFNNGTTSNGFTFFSDLTDRVAVGTTSYNQFYISFTRKLTLTGTTGTANINVNGVNYLATYSTSLTQTATNWVNTNAASILSATGIRVSSVGAEIRFGDDITTLINAITITNVSGTLNGTFVASVGDHVHIPYIGQPYEGMRINHNFRVSFDITVGTIENFALSLRRWADDSIIGAEIPIQRNPDIAGIQENFITYTSGASDPFVTGGFYFSLRNNSGTNSQISGTVGILILNTFQKLVKF